MLGFHHPPRRPLACLCVDTRKISSLIAQIWVKINEYIVNRCSRLLTDVSAVLLLMMMMMFMMLVTVARQLLLVEMIQEVEVTLLLRVDTRMVTKVGSSKNMTMFIRFC